MKTFILLTLIASVASAQLPKDPHVQHGISETQKMLVDPKRRKETFADPKADQANKDLQKLTGGNAQIDQEIWELSSELIPLLAGQTEGDPTKMLKLLEDFKRNPASFASQFPPEQRAKLKAIADKIQKGSKKQP